MDKNSPIFQKGVVDIIDKTDLEKMLTSKKKLKVKFGIDPTGSDLHLGHMVPLRKLAEFQKAGHHIQLLIGTFTAKIGDPTGKTTIRKPLDDEQIQKNLQTYLDQAKKVLDISKAEIVYNGDWYSKISFEKIIQICSTTTVAQILERDMYQERIKKDLPISLHEMFYPLMQGYDSVVLQSDIEIGGTDQLFNLLVGRDLQKHYEQKPQNILTVPILEGLDGKEKMSKSLNNYIGVMESPREQFGKIMSLPDELLWKYFELTTDLTKKEIVSLQKEMNDGANPRDIKMRLGREIVTIYHSEKEALKAQEEFIEMFSKKGQPDHVKEIQVDEKEWRIIDLLFEVGMTSSKGEARRMIEGGGVQINGEKILDIEAVFSPKKDPILFKVGKRKFLNITK